MATTDDVAKDRSAGVKFGIPKIVEASLGTEYANKTSVLETRTLHHDLLLYLESQLDESGLLADLSDCIKRDETSPSVIRTAIGDLPYIRASGDSAIEDYRRISSIATNFKEIVDFVRKCQTFAVEQNPMIQVLKQELADLRKSVNKNKNQQQRAEANQKLKSLECEIEQLTSCDLEAPPEWILSGLQRWIEIFMPDRINFRVYPFPNCPSFQLICNLKRDCFVDQDLEHLLYGYGSCPNVPLGVLGLVTSSPTREGEEFDPLREFSEATEDDDKLKFERAFRNLFRNVDEIESFVKYSRYPNITLHPIAVFRSFAISRKEVP